MARSGGYSLLASSFPALRFSSSYIALYTKKRLSVIESYLPTYLPHAAYQPLELPTYLFDRYAIGGGHHAPSTLTRSHKSSTTNEWVPPDHQHLVTWEENFVMFVPLSWSYLQRSWLACLPRTRSIEQERRAQARTR